MRNTHYYLFLLFLILSACNTAVEEKEGSLSGLNQNIDELIQPYLDSSQIAGVAIGVHQNGDLLHEKAYGYADLNWKTPLTIEANFEIGSITKQFTSVAILQLVAEGKLALDDDFTKYIDYDTKGKTVTIYHLLTHTSGIESYTSVDAFEGIALFDLPRDTLLRMMEDLPFDYEPGTALIYNNTGFYILGLIIEEISGQSYETYLDENVFSKAGMTNTYYCDESKVVSKKAYGYSLGKNGLKKAGYIDHQWPYAAGSLCSTVADLVKWNQALHKDQKLLTPKDYATLIEATQLNSGAKARYTKGLIIDELAGNKRIQHGGGIPGFLSALQYYPAEDLSVVVLINTMGPVNPGKIADHIGQAILASKASPGKDYTGDLNALAGQYSGVGRGQDYEVELRTEGDLLIAKPAFGPVDTLLFTGDFWSSTNDLKYYFKETAPGQINGLELDLKSGYYILQRRD